MASLQALLVSIGCSSRYVLPKHRFGVVLVLGCDKEERLLQGIWLPMMYLQFHRLGLDSSQFQQMRRLWIFF